MSRPVSRRRALATLGSGLLVGLAGCSNDTDGGSDETDESNGTDETTDSSSTGTDENTGTDGSSSNGTDESTGSETKSFTLNFYGGAPDSLETVVVSLDSVTLQSADGGDSPTFQGNETTVDLAALGREKSDPVVDGAELPLGTYDAVTLDFTVEEATTTGGGSPTFDSTTVEQSLAIRGNPATVEASQFDATMTLYLSVQGEGPYNLESTGWQGTGM